MESRLLVLVVLQCVGGLMFQQHLHTRGKTSLSSQVEGGSAFNVPHIQTHQCLTQQTQGLAVTIIRLYRQKGIVHVVFKSYIFPVCLCTPWCKQKSGLWYLCYSLPSAKDWLEYYFQPPPDSWKKSPGAARESEEKIKTIRFSVQLIKKNLNQRHHWPVPGAVCSHKLLHSGRHCNLYCSSELGSPHCQASSLNTWTHKSQRNIGDPVCIKLKDYLLCVYDSDMWLTETPHVAFPLCSQAESLCSHCGKKERTLTKLLKLSQSLSTENCPQDVVFVTSE